MQLSPARFNRLLKPPAGLGQRVLWRRADACPCRDPHSGAAKPGCPVCGGKGTVWGQAAAAWTGLASMKTAREWAAFGLWVSGDVVLTIPSDSPLYSAGENDRIVMTDSSEPFSRVLRRGQVERITAGSVIQIDRVWWIEGGNVVEGTVSIQADGSITWPASDMPAPPGGSGYTVTGRLRPEYFLFKDFPQDRSHHGGALLPRRCVVRRFDLFGR